MPLPTERKSLETGLLDRYQTQKCGGAYNAKSIDNSTGARMPIYSSDGSGVSLSERIWTKPNFLVKGIKESEFKDVTANGTLSAELSIYIKGFNNRKYWH